MEEAKNKNLWISLAVILMIVAGLIFWSRMRSAPEAAPAPLAPENEAISPVASPENTNISSKNVTSPATTISYTEALAKYKNARLQLDKNCQASPGNMTFKNGASIMIDNRAPVARIVKVGSVFSIKAYGFKIVKLSSTTLPATWYVDCDKSQNVSTILIQK